MASLAQFLAAALLGTALAFVALVAIDAIFALIGLGRFGQISGWLALILPALLFFDDVRAWRGHSIRIVVALIAAVAALGLGLFASALTRDAAPVVSGATGAGLAAVVYGFVWFVGIHWLTGVGPGPGGPPAGGGTGRR